MFQTSPRNGTNTTNQKKTMNKNPFKTARYETPEIKTVGDTIKALVDAFSGEGSGDTMGAYILEMAAKEVKERLPKREEEFAAMMERLKKYETA